MKFTVRIVRPCITRCPYHMWLYTQISWGLYHHYNDVKMSAMVSQITSLTIVFSTVCSFADQRNYQSSAPLAFGREIHRWPVNSPHKGPTTRKIFPFDDVIMITQRLLQALKWKQSGHWLTHLCQKHVTFLARQVCYICQTFISQKHEKTLSKWKL